MAGFDQRRADHELRVMDSTHKFAMKMASLVSISIVSIVVLLAVFLGTVTLTTLVILGVIAITLGIITFSVTRSALL